MSLNRLLVSLVENSRRHALIVLLAGFAMAAFSAIYAADHLSVTTDTDVMFRSSAICWWR